MEVRRKMMGKVYDGIMGLAIGDALGAVAGRLAGIYYGSHNIPEEWMQELAGSSEIGRICEDFENKFRV